MELTLNVFQTLKTAPQDGLTMGQEENVLIILMTALQVISMTELERDASLIRKNAPRDGLVMLQSQSVFFNEYELFCDL